jgi:hypothetical protein
MIARALLGLRVNKSATKTKATSGSEARAAIGDASATTESRLPAQQALGLLAELVGSAAQLWPRRLTPPDRIRLEAAPHTPIENGRRRRSEKSGARLHPAKCRPI